MHYHRPSCVRVVRPCELRDDGVLGLLFLLFFFLNLRQSSLSTRREIKSGIIITRIERWRDWTFCVIPNLRFARISIQLMLALIEIYVSL